MAVKGSALILTALCIVVFILQLVIPSLTDFGVLNPSAFVQPWRFVTSIFLHGSFAHLLYNAFALALFGTLLEGFLSPRKFMLIFFASGILANLITVNFYESSLGASGAIFGVIGALVVLKPGMVVWAFGLPMPMVVAGAVWAIGDMIGLFVPSNIANLAHLAGLAVGLLLGLLYREKAPRHHQRSFVLNEYAMRDWEERHLR